MKLWKSSSSALPMFSPSLGLLSFAWISVFVAVLQTEHATAEDNSNYKSPEDHLQEILANERDLEFEEGLQDDNEEAEHLEDDDGLLSKGDLQDLQEATASFYKRISSKAVVNATINGTTTVNSGNTYTFYSHNDFSIISYPNNFYRQFCFALGPSVAGMYVNCSYFRIQNSSTCIDRVVIYSPPGTKITRICGKHHGYSNTFSNGVCFAFITDSRIRKPGFCCTITPIPMTTTSTSTTSTTTTPPCCKNEPTYPPVSQVVHSCADLLPGYSYCQCSNTSNGGICLICSFCQKCDLQFLTAHNFSQTKLYIYFTFPCSNCTLNFTSYDYKASVKGYVNCLNPPTNVTLPTYSVADYVVAIFCPLPTGFDICGYFQSLISGSGRRLSLENGHRKETGHLAKSCSDAFRHLTVLEESFNFSTIGDPETYRVITITGNPCVNFNQGGIIDFSVFANVQVINLQLCTSSLSCGSIILNSSCIQQVTVNLPNASSCNSSCIISNQAPVPPPIVVCP